MYGECGNLSCSRTNETECWAMVERDYFFYLSFENSLCKDYITEKFFNAMKKKLVPIVLGGALNGASDNSDYIKGAGAPLHSFVDVRDYASPKKLANYLNSLYVYPELYAEYFWWKEYYNITTGTKPSQTYCDICRALHDKPNNRSGHKIIEDLEEFWDKGSRCQRIRT